MKKIYAITGFTLALLVTAPSVAQVSRYVEGTHYQVLDTPVRTADAERIEVIELFWYGCPGCYAFEPLMANWEQNAPADVDHKRLPAVWDPITELHAQAFFTAQALDALTAVHSSFFNEYHQNRNRLHNEDLLRDFFESCGVASGDFDQVFNSFSIRSRVNQARRQIAQYGPAETPMMYVNGKYVVTTAAGGYQEMLDVVNYLISLERG
ncbi:MAG: thiol:disulfide interchange protein DsbA/DsbL [Gammaproteobacteria bacterium]